MPEKVSFLTEDGVEIVGELHGSGGTGPAALLLHMMPATKESWREFAAKLVEVGFSTVLAIDLRGHGESRKRGGVTLDFKQFEDREHQDKIKDAEAAVSWMARERGVSPDRLVVVGASIGANLSIVYAADHPEIRAAAALSPGLDYRGVTTADKVMALGAEQALFLAASDEDTLSFDTDRRLKEIKPDAVLKEFHQAGHGTTMFERVDGLMDELAGWLRDRVD
ncbi:hypothetical protein AMJ57_04955 [Parcubacteria bacterium SG8_24]|nr:MAG: hypothetical protein AMJ57_04955 [Parcubacteria bacterium SG8_24]